MQPPPDPPDHANDEEGGDTQQENIRTGHDAWARGSRLRVGAQ